VKSPDVLTLQRRKFVEHGLKILEIEVCKRGAGGGAKSGGMERRGKKGGDKDKTTSS
jgi:hypothetical protein